MKPIIYVLGSSNMDLIVRTPRIPKAGETIIGTQFRTRCGGKGANQAVAVAKLCSDKDEMRFVSVIGDDSNGEVIKKHLLSFGMNLENVIVEPNATTGVATICVDDSGENSIVVIAGANNLFTTDRFNSISIADTCKVFVLQQEIPFDTIKAILEYGKKHDIVTILNPAPASSQVLLDNVDILVPNETESQIITGSKHCNSAEMMDVMTQMKPGLVVIMTLGGEGAFIGRGTERKRVPCPKVEVVDTVGAGDCFVGTFAYQLGHLLEKKTFGECSMDELAEMVRAGCAASSYSVQFRGGCEKYPEKLMSCVCYDTWNTALFKVGLVADLGTTTLSLKLSILQLAGT